MKNFLPVLLIQMCFGLVSGLAAQPTSTPCDSFFLHNGESLSVTIDSIVHRTVLCKLCPSKGSDQFEIPVDSIAQFQIASDSLLALQMQAFLGLRKSGHKAGPVKRWVFKHSVKKKIRSLLKGQEITVVYRDEDSVQVKKTGKLKKIKKQSLIIKTSDNSDLEIDGQKIDWIDRNKFSKKSLSNLGMTLLVLGMLGGAVSLVFSVIASVSESIFSFGSNKNTSDSGDFNIGCLGAILFLVIGIFLYLHFAPKKIDKPFSSDWSITETSAEDRYGDLGSPLEEMP